MRLRPYSFCLGLALLASFACSSTPTTTTAVVRPQLVAVDPADFMGSIHCAATPPASDAGADASADAGAEADLDRSKARSYVATLFDVTPDVDGGIPESPIPLASSPPTSCLKPVTFAFVVDQHHYLAEVDAYYQRDEDLTAISAGSRLLFDRDGKRALASWVATCGGYPPSPAVDAGTATGGAGGATGVVSYAAITRTPHDCDGLHPPDAP